jgi:hypothetical protein
MNAAYPIDSTLSPIYKPSVAEDVLSYNVNASS